ncbi:hypothetical protein LCGC14_0225440 [marine sediment metagenome]|uniref:Uncharacterized protein n=1 Tax=marine sediment metagenome TaxID=412755 RepID=A0A0F9UCQ7_9ZZZZ
MEEIIKDVNGNSDSDWVICHYCRLSFHKDNVYYVNDIGHGTVICHKCYNKRKDEHVLCTKCQISYNMLGDIKYGYEGEPYCKTCYNKTEFKKYVINEFIDLRLIGDRTDIFINGKRFFQCMFLLINIPTMEAEDENCVNIDEFQRKYSGEMEVTDNSEEHLIPPETEFWGHCSNIQAWVENKYNPNVLHSNLAMPLLKELCHKDIHIFHSLLTHLDTMWKEYKTRERKEFVMNSYREIVFGCIRLYNIDMENANNSIFLRALYHLRVCANMDIFIRDVYQYVKAKDDRLAKIILGLTEYDNYWNRNAGRDRKSDTEWKAYQRRRSYWERKIYGNNLQYRRWLRQLRDHDVSVVSDYVDYLPYLWSKDLVSWSRLDDRGRYGHSTLIKAYISEGIEYTYFLDWVHKFCSGWNGSHNLSRYAVRYKDGTIAIRHLVI